MGSDKDWGDKQQEWLKQNTSFMEVSSGILLLFSALVCWYLIAELTNNKRQDALAVSIVVAGIAYITLNYWTWRRATKRTLAFLNDAEPLLNSKVKDELKVKRCLAPLEVIWEKLQCGRLHHQDILMHITSLQYAMARTLIPVSLGGAIAAFLILPKGWDHTTDTLKTVFLSFAVLATYCGVVPRVLCLDKNMIVHMARYQSFLQLRWMVYHHIMSVNCTNKDVVNQFLLVITDRLSNLPPTPLGIDPSQVGSIANLAKQFSLNSTTIPESPITKIEPQGPNTQDSDSKKSETERKETIDESKKSNEPAKSSDTDQNKGDGTEEASKAGSNERSD